MSPKQIDLNFNKIKSIDSKLFNGLLSLERIILNKNKLTSLELVFSNLVNLKEIQLRENQLKTLPPQLFNGLGNSLQIIDLSSNFLNRLDKDTFKDLKSL